MGKKKEGGGPESANITVKTAKDMTARQRILALRLNHRQEKEEGKRLSGSVSEIKTDFKNMLLMAIPDSGEEAKRRLRDLQLKHEEFEERKNKRAGFKAVCKATKHALLFAEITENGQTVLPGVELEVTPEMAKHLKASAVQAKAADAIARENDDDEAKPAYPIEDAGDLDAFASELDAFAQETGMSANSLGTPEATAKGGEVVPIGGKSKTGAKGKNKDKGDDATPPMH